MAYKIPVEVFCPADKSAFVRILPLDDPARGSGRDWDCDYYRLYREKYEIIKEQEVKSILEIGVRSGYSMHTFLSAWPKASYLGLDAENNLHGGQHGPWTWWARILMDKYFPGGERDIIISDTQKLSEVPGGPYDFIHVDGDHTADGAYHDMKICWPFVAAGGRMVIDDYTFLPEVAKGVDRWLDDFGDLPSAVDFRGTVRGDVVVYQ